MTLPGAVIQINVSFLWLNTSSETENYIWMQHFSLIWCATYQKSFDGGESTAFRSWDSDWLAANNPINMI